VTAGAWTLTVDIPSNEWLSANGRYGHYKARAGRVMRLRRRAAVLARSQGLAPCVGRVRIVATVHGRARGISDPNNAADSTKAIVDGLRDARVLADDDHTHVVGPDHRHGEPLPRELPRGWHRIVLTITPEGKQ
jgi:hypothetical protein